MAQRKYLDLVGLREFKDKLLQALASNSSEAYTVNYATTAGSATSATQDGSGNVITTEYMHDTDATHTSRTAKLDAIEAGAQANVVEGVSLDGTTQTITSKIVELDLSAYAKKTDITSIMKFKGTKTSDELAALTGMVTGDVYSIVSGGSSTTYKVGSEYAYDGSAWVELGPVIDLSGYVETSRTINSKALTSDIVLDGSDVALSSNYAEAISAAAISAGDSLDIAVGKLEKRADVNADAIEALESAATTYAFSEGSVDGAFQVTPTIGGTAGSSQSVTIHGLGSAAYADTTDFVSSTLTPAEAGAEVNDIISISVNNVAQTIDANRNVNITVPSAEVTDVQVKGNGEASYTSVVSATVAQIDLSAYALDADITSITNSEIDGLFN